MRHSALAVAGFADAGYLRIEPAILQPLAPFLDLSGEDIRRRMFVTQDGSGGDWCLRPEYTIPVAMQHLAQSTNGHGSYCYAGPVFRLRSGEAGEFIQAGLESFGRDDKAAADAEILGLTLEAVAALGVPNPVIRMGDAAILSSFLDALDVPGAARRRLFRAVARGDLDPLASLDTPKAGAENGHAGLIAALEGQDPKAAMAFVEDVLSIAGISNVGGRSARDIAERFLAKASEKDQAVSDLGRQILGQVFAVSGDPDSVSATMRGLAAASNLGIDSVFDELDARIGFVAARGIDLDAVQFSTRFARNLDYYTGFVFEFGHPLRPDGKPVAGGGRYDALLQRLGAAQAVPAVGASLWLDRLAMSASKEQA